MKILKLTVPLVLIGMVTVAMALRFGTHQGSPMKNPVQVLEDTTSLLLAATPLGLSRADCRPLFNRDVSASTRCFITKVDPNELSALMKQHLDQIGVTAGWRDDYGVPGAFYALKDQPQQTFGVTVNPIEGWRAVQNIKAFQGFKSFVGLTVNLHPGQR